MTRTSPRLAAWLAIMAWALAGVAAGVVAKLADTLGTWWADAGTYPALWVVPLAAAARTSRSPGRAALRSAAFFIPMTAAYYAWAQVVLGFASTRYMIAWIVLATTVVPPAAAVVRWSRDRSDPVAAVAIAALASLAFTGGAVRRVWLAASGAIPSAAAHPVQAALEVAVAAGVVMWLPRTRRARLEAALVLVPLGWYVLGAVSALPLPF